MTMTFLGLVMRSIQVNLKQGPRAEPEAGQGRHDRGETQLAFA